MPKKETKKQERKPKKTAQTTQRKAKLTRLQKLEQEKQELFDRFCKLTTTNREKAEYICKQREQINKLVNANINATNEIYACQLEKDKIIVYENVHNITNHDMQCMSGKCITEPNELFTPILTAIIKNLGNKYW